MCFVSTLIDGSHITFQNKSQNDCHRIQTCGIQNIFLVVNLTLKDLVNSRLSNSLILFHIPINLQDYSH